MYVCVCVCARVCACLRVCVYVRMYIYIFARVNYVWVYQACVCTALICMFIFVCEGMYMYCDVIGDYTVVSLIRSTKWIYFTLS
jgi:hypothetical protein